MAPRLLVLLSVQTHSRIPVAVFLTSFDAGGTERQMIELAIRLDRDRFEVRIACFHRRGVWLPRLADAVAEIVEFPIHSFRSPSILAHGARFAQWCRARRIAVVQAADLYANAFALPAATAAGVEVRVGSRREVHPSRGRGLEALQRFGYRAAHRIVANSDAGARRLELEGIAPARITVVRNGIDFDRFDGLRSPSRSTPLITVARLRPEKAHEVLIAAVGRLSARWPLIQLQIVGDGPRESELRRQVEHEGLARHVQFLGHRDDVPQLLREADIFVLPSRIEASPNAALEAMAAGLPVVASKVGGIPEVIADGQTGLLVPPDNPDALAAALHRLMDNPAEGERIGAAARQFVRSHYSFDRMVGAFETLYLDELSRRRSDRLDARFDPVVVQKPITDRTEERPTPSCVASQASSHRMA